MQIWLAEYFIGSIATIELTGGIRANMKEEAYATVSRAHDLSCSPFKKRRESYTKLYNTSSLSPFLSSMLLDQENGRCQSHQICR